MTCKNTSNCEWYTYNPDGGLCLLLDTCPTVDVDSCPDCLSGAFIKTDSFSPSILRFGVLGEVACDLLLCNQVGICIGTIIHSEGSEDVESWLPGEN